MTLMSIQALGVQFQWNVNVLTHGSACNQLSLQVTSTFQPFLKSGGNVRADAQHEPSHQQACLGMRGRGGQHAFRHTEPHPGYVPRLRLAVLRR